MGHSERNIYCVTSSLDYIDFENLRG